MNIRKHFPLLVEITLAPDNPYAKPTVLVFDKVASYTIGSRRRKATIRFVDGRVRLMDESKPFLAVHVMKPKVSVWLALKAVFGGKNDE